MSLFESFYKKNRVLNKLKESEEKGKELFLKAIQFNQFGNQTEAIRLFSESIEVNPVEASVYLNRGACFMIQERYLEAIDDFNMVIKIEHSRKVYVEESCYEGAIANINRLAPLLSFEKEHGEMVRGQMRNDGIEHFTKRYTEVLLEEFLDYDSDLTSQFVDEELKELAEMGGEHQEFALNCGIEHKTFSNVTAEFNTSKAFLFFKSVLCCISRDHELMFDVRKQVLINLSFFCENKENNIERLFDVEFDNLVLAEIFSAVRDCRIISNRLELDDNPNDIEELKSAVQAAIDLAIPIYENLARNDLAAFNALVIVNAFYMIELADNAFKETSEFSDIEIENVFDAILAASGVPEGTVESSKFIPAVRVTISWIAHQR